MPFHDLSKVIKIVRLTNSTAAGTSNITTSTVDTAGFEGCEFIAFMGALTATQVTRLKVQSSTDDGATDPYADVAGSGTAFAADGDSNKMLITDCYRPSKRYLKAVLLRGTANAAVDGIIAILYRPGYIPAALDTTVSSQTTIANAAPGTA